jgi:NADH-quinone oxidoreductase subunit J
MLIGWLAASYVVTQPDPVRSVFALIVTVACLAVHWSHIGATFLALLLLLVYLGAVMVFFLFIVMTLPKDNAARAQQYSWQQSCIPLFLALITGPALASSLTTKGISVLKNSSLLKMSQISVIIFEKYGVLLQYLGLALFVTMLVVVAILQPPKEKP